MILISAAQVLFAIATIMLAGFAVLRLIASQAEAGPLAERIGLCWLLGGGWISVMIVALGIVLNGAALIIGVIVSVGGLAFAGRRGREDCSVDAERFGKAEFLVLAILAAEAAVIGVFASRIALGWDALMTWEWKARLAFLNGGSLPAGYFSDATYDWSLPRYPLQLPYVGSWLYLCLGRVDQAWARVIGPLYYLAAAGVVAGACQRLGSSRRTGLCAAAAMFFVPYIFSGTWGMYAGYADLPLGALLLAAISRIPSIEAESNIAHARLLGVLAALLPWMKREGQHFWLIVLLLALIQLWRAKAWRALPWVATPGIAMIAALEGSMAVLHTLPYRDAVAVSMGGLDEKVGRLGFVENRLISELVDFDAWSLLWPGAVVAIIALLFRRRFAIATTFGGALVLGWSLLGTGYIFGFPHDLEAMISITIDRIVLQFVPLGVLTVALAVPPAPSKTEN
jgi:hypothetical protein